MLISETIIVRLERYMSVIGSVDNVNDQDLSGICGQPHGLRVKSQNHKAVLVDTVTTCHILHSYLLS